jgi:hypothetical protein
MEINVTRFTKDLGDTWHNQVNLGKDAATISWNEALEATQGLETLTPEECEALYDHFTGMGCEDVSKDPTELMALLRQLIRCLQLEYDPENPDDTGNELFKTEDNQWYLSTC